MRTLVTGDWHLNWTTHGVRRFDELGEAVGVTVKTAIAEEVDAYVFLGDLCDPDAGSAVFRCVELAIRTAVELREAGISSLWMAGNHDVIEDGTGDTTLTPMRAICDEDLICLAERPGFYMLGHGFGMAEQVNIAALPFTATSHTYDPTAAVEKIVAENKLSGKEWLLVGHLSVPGVIPGEETKDMPRGRDVVYPVEAMKRLKPTHAVNGHYHRRQVSPDGVIMPGALARLTFNEEGNKPGFLVLEY